MFDGVIGKILFFWIFMIGAVFVARILGFWNDTKTMIIFLIACAIIYAVWVGAKALGKRRRGE